MIHFTMAFLNLVSRQGVVKAREVFLFGFGFPTFGFVFLFLFVLLVPLGLFPVEGGGLPFPGDGEVFCVICLYRIP